MANTRSRYAELPSPHHPCVVHADMQMSSGGLVSALSGCKKTMSFTWIGWPGKDVSAHANRVASLLRAHTPCGLHLQIPVQDRDYVNQRLLEEYQCYPVYLTDDVADRHYNGVCRRPSSPRPVPTPVLTVSHRIL